MGDLQYSIFRYAPSLVSGEKINLAAVFYYNETGYREFYSISKWSRISAFDDTLNILVLKSLMEDIKNEIGTPITWPDFDLKRFCLQYDSELYFDKCETLTDISCDQLSDQIEEIKRMYFQFEFDIVKRPVFEDQRKFLRKLLVSKQVGYIKDATKMANFDAEIKYDYVFGEYGVVFFNFNTSKVDNKTMNKVKAWAWNAQNSTDNLKLIVLYDSSDENRPELKPALDILRSAATMAININKGFGEVSELIEKSISIN